MSTSNFNLKIAGEKIEVLDKLTEKEGKDFHPAVKNSRYTWNGQYTIDRLDDKELIHFINNRESFCLMLLSSCFLL